MLAAALTSAIVFDERYWEVQYTLLLQLQNAVTGQRFMYNNRLSGALWLLISFRCELRLTSL